MQLKPDLLTPTDLRTAVDVELDEPARLLPPSTVNRALEGRRDEVAEWAHSRFLSNFVPTREEIVAVSKPGHGVRPVAIWDLPSRLAYSALVEKLSPTLPVLSRGSSAWKDFQRKPLARSGNYILSSDIAACYHYVDHGLLTDELLVQGGHPAVIEAIAELLRAASGRTYGLPQQSRSSDRLAESFLSRLERALVRRGLQVARYNDDFRFTCPSWSETIRTIEILAEETRELGFTINDMKTITWKRESYERSLAEADRLREAISTEAEWDLTDVEVDPYENVIGVTPAEPTDVEELGARRILLRWSLLLGEDGRVPEGSAAEHRALLQLITPALRTLQRRAETDDELLDLCAMLLRFEQTTTPLVGNYLQSRSDNAAVLAAFDKLLADDAYLNGWQTWWLQQPVARLSDFANGENSSTRLRWVQQAFESGEHRPILKAQAALTLARHGRISIDSLLQMYSRSGQIVRPVLVAAIALLGPRTEVRDSIIGDSPLHRWMYDWAPGNV